MLPFLSEVQNKSKKYNVVFRGINYGEGTQDGEFADTYNLSTAKYPCITQSAIKTKVINFGNVTTLHSKGDLLIIDHTKVYYGFYLKLVGEVAVGKKQIATIGNYIVIFPDKKYYKVPTEDDPDGEFGDMEETYTAEGLVFTDSTITTTGDSFKFRVGDAVKISGCSIPENNQTIIVRDVSGNKLTFYENSFTEGTERGTVTIKREVPDLDLVCECNNRLWGTHGNTIFSSAFGDPFNFFTRDGLSSDGYDIEVGSEGEFTGCIPYSSHICFFKENTLHKLYGTKPSNFQITTVNIHGVQRYSERSMQIVNEQLIYKGVNGVYAYTGGVPELISENFGNKRFSFAVACCDGETYYISMFNLRDNKWSFFSYDVAKNIWLREDDTRALDMAFHDGNVYYAGEDGAIYIIDKDAERSDIEWGATFCTIHETINERKGYSKFHLRMDLAAGAWLALDIKTDNDLTWRQVYTTHNEKAKTVSIPILPTRCDSIDIRLRGKGECTIKAFIREFTVGSDV